MGPLYYYTVDNNIIYSLAVNTVQMSKKTSNSQYIKALKSKVQITTNSVII